MTKDKSISRKTHEICRRFDLALMFAWDPQYYLVVDRRELPWRYVTSEADIHGTYLQLQEKMEKLETYKGDRE